jgi:hypothetical protein
VGDLHSGFGRVGVFRFPLQLAHRAFGELDVIAHLTKVFRLDEFSIGSGLGVADFDNLLHAGNWITVGHTYRPHETGSLAVQEIHGDGAMSVIHSFLWLGADDE